MLQRFLCKWGGEFLPRTSPQWWAYRELFLGVADQQVPLRCRHEPFATEWDELYALDLGEVVDTVRSLHENTNYDWDSVWD